MIIERCSPLISIFVEREYLGVGKAERRIAADIGIVEFRETPVLVIQDVLVLSQVPAIGLTQRQAHYPHRLVHQ